MVWFLSPASRLDTQEEPMLQSESRSRKTLMSSQAGGILSHQGRVGLLVLFKPLVEEGAGVGGHLLYSTLQLTC